MRGYLVGAGSSLVLEKNGEPRLSDGVMKTLYDLQGILGASSIADAVERAYRDEVAAMKFKLNLWEEYAPYGEEYTLEGLINVLVENVEELESELKVYTDGYAVDSQTIIELKDGAQTVYEMGEASGYQAGMEDFAIHVRCVHCEKPILVEPKGSGHALIMSLVSEIGVGHSSCINRVQYKRDAGSHDLEKALRI